MGGYQLASHKPDPAVLFHAKACLGTASCLFVGDSEIDRETAAPPVSLLRFLPKAIEPAVLRC